MSQLRSLFTGPILDVDFSTIERRVALAARPVPLRSIKGRPLRVVLAGESLVRLTDGRWSYVYDPLIPSLRRITPQVELATPLRESGRICTVLKAAGLRIGTARAACEGCIFIGHRLVGKALRVLRSRGYKVTVRGVRAYRVTR